MGGGLRSVVRPACETGKHMLDYRNVQTDLDLRYLDVLDLLEVLDEVLISSSLPFPSDTQEVDTFGTRCTRGLHRNIFYYGLVIFVPQHVYIYI